MSVIFWSKVCANALVGNKGFHKLKALTLQELDTDKRQEKFKIILKQENYFYFHDYEFICYHLYWKLKSKFSIIAITPGKLYLLVMKTDLNLT